MTERDDPPRLFEPASGAPPALGELFRRAREDLPAPGELALLSQRIDAAVGRPAPSPSPSSPFGGKAALGVGVGLVGLAIGLWLLSSKPAATPAPENTAQAPSAPIAPAVPAPRALPIQSAEPTPAPTAVPDAAPSSKPAAAAPQRGRDSAPGAPRGPSEAALLEAARAALATNPAKALALTREHARRFPSGVLAQEREVIAIEALRRTGKASAADARANEFQQQYPGSPHRRTIDTKAP